MPDPHLPPNAPEPRSAPRPATFLRVLGAVFAAFFGVRRRASGERDALSIRPVHVIVAGVLGAALFVGALVVLVRFVTRHG